MVFNSPYPDLPVPDEDLWTFLLEREHPSRTISEDKEQYICGATGRSYTRRQFRNAAAAFGSGLKSRWNLQKGDVLAICSPNSVDYPVMVFGTFWAGGTVSTMNPMYTVQEIVFQLKDSNCKGIVTIMPLLPKIVAAAKEAGISENRIILLDQATDPSGKFQHFTELRDTGLSATSRVKIDPSADVAIICYSSGTTGLPKGVPLTHKNIIADVVATTSVDDLCGLSPAGGLDGKGDKQLAILPFFHSYGLSGILIAGAYQRFQIVILPKYELEKVLGLIQQYHISFLYLPPPIVLALAKHPVVQKYDLSSIKWITCGAAPLSSELIDAVWERLTIPVKQAYGLSETAPGTHLQEVLDWAKHKGSVGKLIPNMQGKLINTEGEEVQPGEEGELWVKGPNVFSGYLNRPELNDEIFGEDSFFKTGDVGYMDRKGNLYITDRLKELIKYKGLQIAPAELEGKLRSHEDVLDACVVAVYDPDRASEIPRAYIVLKPNVPQSDSKAKDIVEWIARRVTQHKQLRGGVRFISAIPYSASGKVLRRVLRDQAKEESVDN